MAALPPGELAHQLEPEENPRDSRSLRGLAVFSCVLLAHVVAAIVMALVLNHHYGPNREDYFANSNMPTAEDSLAAARAASLERVPLFELVNLPVGFGHSETPPPSEIVLPDPDGRALAYAEIEHERELLRAGQTDARDSNDLLPAPEPVAPPTAPEPPSEASSEPNESEPVEPVVQGPPEAEPEPDAADPAVAAEDNPEPEPANPTVAPGETPKPGPESTALAEAEAETEALPRTDASTLEQLDLAQLALDPTLSEAEPPLPPAPAPPGPGSDSTPAPVEPEPLAPEPIEAIPIEAEAVVPLPAPQPPDESEPNEVANPWRWYDIQVDRTFREQWHRPARTSPGQPAAATINVVIARDGRVDARLVQPSGNPALDQSVTNLIQRVREVAPLPPDYPHDLYRLAIRYEID